MYRLAYLVLDPFGKRFGKRHILENSFKRCTCVTLRVLQHLQENLGHLIQTFGHLHLQLAAGNGWKLSHQICQRCGLQKNISLSFVHSFQTNLNIRMYIFTIKNKSVGLGAWSQRPSILMTSCAAPCCGALLLQT